MQIKQKLRTIKKKISAIYLAMKRKDTPILAKIMSGITVAYALSPIDLIPDFIPVLGYLDDLLILPILILITIKLIPKDIMEECELSSEHIWESGKHKNFWYGVPIIIIWILILALILFKIF